MKKEFEDYLKERGLPSASDWFAKGPEIYPAAIPEEIARAMFVDLFGDPTQSSPESCPVAPELSLVGRVDRDDLKRRRNLLWLGSNHPTKQNPKE